jgi:L-amino acid N-acyltransferase YncA
MAADSGSSSVHLRDATPADVGGLARLHVLTFNETHGPGPDSTVREQQWHSWFESQDSRRFCVVLETEHAELVGFARGQPHADAELADFGGELNKIYLLRAYHRRGLGRRLLCASARRFLERIISSMLLFGDARSPTNRFYEAMGAERLYAPNGDFHGGYGWHDLAALVSAHCARSAVE